MNKPICKHPGCGSAFLVDGEYCWNHSPTVSDEERARARSRGGSAVRRRLEATPGDIESHKPDSTQQAALEAQRAAIGAMLSALQADPHNLKISSALSLAAKRLSQQLVAVDLDERLRAVEEELERRKKRG